MYMRLIQNVNKNTRNENNNTIKNKSKIRK